MNVRLRVDHTDTEELLRRYIGRRLRFALGRFGGRVRSVDVSVHGAEGRSGDSRCRITTEMLPSGRFSVDERGLDLFAAIDRAAARVGKRFGKDLDRKRRVTRDSIRLASAM
jgi:hypothetical protein